MVNGRIVFARIARCEIHGIVGNVGRLEQSRLSATEIHAAVKKRSYYVDGWPAILQSYRSHYPFFCVHRMPSTGVRQLTVRHINERTIRRDRMAVDAVRIILCPQHGITEQINKRVDHHCPWGRPSPPKLTYNVELPAQATAPAGCRCLSVCSWTSPVEIPQRPGCTHRASRR